MDQAITPKDPRGLFQRLFGWTYEPIEWADSHAPWIMGGNPRERGNLVHAKDFDQHPAWSKCEDRYKWGDILCDENPSEDYDDRVWICRAFCAYVNFRLKSDSFLVEPGEDIFFECFDYNHEWPDMWRHMTRCLGYCLVSITKKERKAIFELLLNTHLWCMSKREICYRPEFALITGFQSSFLWAIPYREAYREVNHGLSELEELYESVPAEEFLKIFYGEDRDGMQDLSEANIEGYEPEEVGIPPIYAWDISGHINQPDSSSCTHLFQAADCSLFDSFRANFDTKKRLHHELGVLLGREKQKYPKAGKKRKKK